MRTAASRYRRSDANPVLRRRPLPICRNPSDRGPLHRTSEGPARRSCTCSTDRRAWDRTDCLPRAVRGNPGVARPNWGRKRGFRSSPTTVGRRRYRPHSRWPRRTPIGIRASQWLTVLRPRARASTQAAFHEGSDLRAGRSVSCSPMRMTWRVRTCGRSRRAADAGRFRRRCLVATGRRWRRRWNGWSDADGRYGQRHRASNGRRPGSTGSAGQPCALQRLEPDSTLAYGQPAPPFLRRIVRIASIHAGWSFRHRHWCSCSPPAVRNTSVDSWPISSSVSRQSAVNPGSRHEHPLHAPLRQLRQHVVGVRLQPLVAAEQRLVRLRPLLARPAEPLDQRPRRAHDVGGVGVARAGRTSAGCRGS